MDVETGGGTARAWVDPAGAGAGAGAVGTLVLGHGAGGSVEAPDLLAVRDAVVAAGWTVVRVEQPYRVAGRRTAPRAPALDEAWLAVVAALGVTGPLVVGGRSSGARVACRTAGACGAAGVVCLAFPLVPPRRRPGAPEVSREHELAAVTVPVLVVQGRTDAFGTVQPAPGREVVVVAGDHALRRDAPAVAAAVVGFLG